MTIGLDGLVGLTRWIGRDELKVAAIARTDEFCRGFGFFRRPNNVLRNLNGTVLGLLTRAVRRMTLSKLTSLRNDHSVLSRRTDLATKAF